ncbi:hypothetical protein FF1_014571 [Malus domestica]
MGAASSPTRLRSRENARQGARIKAGVGDVEYMDGRWVNTGVLKLVVEDLPSRHPPLLLPPPPCSSFFLLLRLLPRSCQQLQRPLSND